MYSLQDTIRKGLNLEKYGLKVLSNDDLSKLHKVLLSMYLDIADFCDRNHLQYVLAGGSALGVVRHGGFIPWDDDIDLMMPRKDYNRFMELFEKQFERKYAIASPYRKHQDTSHCIQVINKQTTEFGIWDQALYKYPGVCIDICAIDFVPENRVAYYIRGVVSDLFFFLVNCKMMYRCHTSISNRIFSENVLSMGVYYIRLFLGFMLGWISYEDLCYLYDKFISSCKPSSLVSIPPGRDHYFKETRPMKVLLPFKECTFEGCKAYIPHDTDAYLKQLFGQDYMAIPPKEKREPHAVVELEL